MCGIAGQLLRCQNADSHVDPEIVRRMCGVIRHRGPDDEGYYTGGPCSLGMRRLSIIDLATGHQPISNEDQTIWIVFNGEIYNYQALRRDLISAGHVFRTNSDTETLVHLYEQEGVNGLSKLRGMFAFALWDARRRSLLLARDPFGKKPLYYAAMPDGLYFGSELKCLRAAGLPLDIDPQAIRLYLQLTYIPDPWSPYRQIRKLPAGSWMTCAADGRIESGRYWKLPPPNSGASMDSESAICERLRATFDESVRLRMIADVPLGAFLSGGIDSSLVVASMAAQSNSPVKTFSIGFEESDFNELPHAAEIARQYRTEHHAIMVRPDSLELVARVASHLDEPLGDSAAIPTFLVSQFAAQHVKVCLTGDGGDELFGGYESFFDVERRHWMDRLPGSVRRATSWLADRLPYSTYGKNYLRMLSRSSALERYFEANTAPHFLRQQLLQPEWNLPDGEAFLRDTFSDYLLPPSAGMLSQALFFEATAKLTGNMLVKVDRMSMANSLEVRCPLLDTELAALAAQIPNGWKIRNGSGKWILRKALGDRLPPSILQRKKMGFGFPLSIWFRGPLREFLRDHLQDPRFLGRGIVSPDFLRVLLDEHQRARRDNSHWLWLLLMLELWFREAEQSRARSAPVSELSPCAR